MSNTWQHTVATGARPLLLLNDVEPNAVWRYSDTAGQCLGYRAQYGSKMHAWTFGRYSENVDPEWEKHTWTHGRIPLYGLDRLGNYPDAPVCICATEAEADTMQRMLPAMVCMSWAGGALDGIDWQPLIGRGGENGILLIPGYDIAGVGAMTMMRVAAYLMAIGCMARILDNSDQPHGLDGWSGKDAFIAWAKPRIRPLTSEQVERQRMADDMAAIPHTSDDQPTPLPEDPQQHVPFTIDVVPTRIKDAPMLPEAKLKPHTKIETTEYMPDAFSERGLALTWLKNDGTDWAYTPAWAQWAKWDGTRWHIDRTNSVTRMVGEEMARAVNWPEARDLSTLQKRSLSSRKNIANVLALAGAQDGHLPEHWDSDPMLLGTPGGVVDLRNGELRQARREDFITKSTKYTPDFSRCTENDMPNFMSVLARAHGGREMVEYLQRWFYYVLTGDVRFECFLFCYGPGGSGKSTLVYVLQELVGEYAVAAGMETFAATQRQEHTTEIARLAGARLVTATETEKNSHWNESRIKTLTGQDKLSANFMRQDKFDFTPLFKLCITGNHKPRLKSVGEEMRRRIHLVNFPTSMTDAEKKTDIRQLLSEEMPGILAWAIQGGDSWRAKGMTRPAIVDAAINEYLQGEDTLGHWLEQCCRVAPGLRCASGEAYASYKSFVELAGEGIQAQKGFVQEMEQRGFERRASHGVRYIVGLEIKPPELSYSYGNA